MPNFPPSSTPETTNKASSAVRTVLTGQLFFLPEKTSAPHKNLCPNQQQRKHLYRQQNYNTNAHNCQTQPSLFGININFGKYINEKTIYNLIYDCTGVYLPAVIKQGNYKHGCRYNKRSHAERHSESYRHSLPQYSQCCAAKAGAHSQHNAVSGNYRTNNQQRSFINEQAFSIISISICYIKRKGLQILLLCSETENL